MNVIEINGGITINVNVSVKNILYMEKIIIRNAPTCSCKNRKYLPSMDDSGITCDEIIEEIVPTNFNEKK